MTVPEELKPSCELTGTDGNVFALAGRVSRCLKRNGLDGYASQFQKELLRCKSYDEALRLMMEYVEVT